MKIPEKIKMQADKKILSVMIVSALTLLFAGCSQIGESAKVIFNPDAATQQQSTASPKRFQESDPQKKTVVNSAIELSEKYAALSEEKIVLHQKNLELTTENKQLEQKVTALEPQLKQAKKELAEANDLLIEMRIELNNWKTNIIGFRDEIRDADKTQLEALLKILKVLGGEIKDENPKEPQQNSTTQSQ
jgi:outer membrane murein-binding lipoprotein Lpp